MAERIQLCNLSENNFEQCTKCSICTTVCPVATVTTDYPGPKQAGPDGERYRLKDPAYFDKALKLCLNCKRCEVACPSGVHIADIIQLARMKATEGKHASLRDTLLANTDLLGTMANLVAPVANTTLGLAPTKLVMDSVMAIDKHRTFPAYSRQKFTTWFKRHAAKDQDAYANHVSYFHGCYVNYNFPKLGQDLVKLLNAIGFGVHLLDKEQCCGVALIANGLYKQARRQARTNAASIRKSVNLDHRTVLTTSSSCTFNLRDEYPAVLDVDTSDVRDGIMLATRFIYNLVDEEQIKLIFKQDYKRRIAYHTACHMQRMGWQLYSIELLRMIPGLDLQVLEQECCGISGTYGFKKENYERSQAIGSVLFKSIEEAKVEAVATDCETCKWQIEMSTGLPVENPISILADALDVEATRKANGLNSFPTLELENAEKEVKFTVGARMMADAAYYNSDFTPLQSGASITDARIRTSMTYKNWYFYADFGFGGGKFAQKNIFVQYTTLDNNDNTHAVKVGYYNDPASSMARNTSLGSYHFISRPGSTNALGEGRELGISYKFNNDRFMAYQGIFTENAYNKIEAGFNGMTVAGRYLFRPIVDETQTLHIGANVRFAHMGGGVVTNNVLKKTLHLGQSLETYVDDDDQFVSCDLPWINNVFDAGAEALYHNDRFFVRGEYLYKHTTKKRDTNTLWEASNNNIDTWGSYDWWLAANPLRNDNFHGGYVEAGFMLFGNPYHYNMQEGLLGGLDGKALEVVARWNYTSLNDVNEGEYYAIGRDQYYPNGYMEDWPYASSSVGGGKANSYTIGLNYSFNKYVLCMFDYTYHRLQKDFLPYDRNVHVAQARVQFTF